MKPIFIKLLILIISFNQYVFSQTGWLKINPPNYGNITSLSFLDQNTGFIGISGSLYKTTNSGVNWVFLPSGAGQKIQFMNSNTGYTSDVSAMNLYKTTNGGSNWSLVYQYGPLDFYFMNTDTGWICNSTQICRTIDGGNNWNCSGAPNGRPVFSVYFGSLNFGICTGAWYDLLHGFITYHYAFRSTNSGLSWYCINHTEPNDTCAVASCYNFGGCSLFRKVYLIDGSEGFLFGGDFNPLNIYRTLDTARHWVQMSVGTSVNNFSFLNNNTGYGAGTGTIIYTTDFGTSWTNQYVGDTAQVNDIKMINSMTGWAVGNYGLILRTTTGGIITIPPPPVLTVPINGASGVSLTPILQWMQIFDNVVTYSYRVFIASDSLFNQIRDSVTVTTNSYQVPPGRLQNSTTYYWKTMAISSIYGQGPWSSVYHFTTLMTGINILSTKIPNSFSLSQNYPNPFNPKTIINFQLPIINNVKLIIYNVLGHEVAVLLNQQLQPGTYEVEWDATNFPSGMYFYKLTTDSFNESKRMMLIK
ncbi:MAG: T9SS type A sorting domain-containing protein [Ignavibacteria bacterium]